MKTIKTIAFICYILVAAMGFLFALIYLTRPEFMPYHADAVGKEWNDVNAGIQVLIIALMRVAGGGWLATSISITCLLIAGKKFEQMWLKIALVLVGLAALIPTLYATLFVRSHSPGEPPWIAAAIGILLLFVALLFDFLIHRKSKIIIKKSKIK